MVVVFMSGLFTERLPDPRTNMAASAAFIRDSVISMIRAGGG